MQYGWREIPGARERLVKSFAYGVLNFGYAVEREAKREAPVRGGYRSFMTTKTGKAGQVLVGGTLRRSIHTAVFQDGVLLAGGQDENGKGIPNYPTGPGVVGYVGTNCGYGRYVEEGTVKMSARPFLTPALDGLRSRAPEIIAAGARRVL